jgi:hypothetical protein
LPYTREVPETPKLPLKVGRDGLYIDDADGDLVARVQPQLAQYIVSACNAFAPLTKACEKALKSDLDRETKKRITEALAIAAK